MNMDASDQPWEPLIGNAIINEDTRLVNVVWELEPDETYTIASTRTRGSIEIWQLMERLKMTSKSVENGAASLEVHLELQKETLQVNKALVEIHREALMTTKEVAKTQKQSLELQKEHVETKKKADDGDSQALGGEV
jgi:predicted  nucleic acid-binding Zn-ribbon protein